MGGWQPSNYRIYVSKIEDLRGNTIDFKYHRFTPVPSLPVKGHYKVASHVYPEKITTSLGQEVNFSYEKNSNLEPTLDYIEEDRGGDTPALFDFNYRFDKQWSKSKYCSFLGGTRLSKDYPKWCGEQKYQYRAKTMVEDILLPDGRKLTFKYQGPIASNIFNGSRYMDTYPAISEFTTSDGLHVAYEYQAFDKSDFDPYALTDNDFKSRTAHLRKRTQTIDNKNTVYNFIYNKINESEYTSQVMTPWGSNTKTYYRKGMLRGKLKKDKRYTGEVIEYTYNAIKLLPKISSAYKYDDGKYSISLKGADDGLFKTEVAIYGKYNKPSQINYYDKYGNVKSEKLTFRSYDSAYHDARKAFSTCVALVHTSCDFGPGPCNTDTSMCGVMPDYNESVNGLTRWISKLESVSVRDKTNMGEEIQVLLNRYNDYAEIENTINYGIENGYTYDDSGYVSSRNWFQNGLELSETYENYIRNIPTKVTRSDDSVLARGVDMGSGVVLWQADLAGLKTTYKYDSNGALKETTYPKEYNFNVKYEDHSLISNKRATVITQGDFRSETIYDAFSNVISRKKSGVNVSSPEEKLSYNAHGLVTEKSQVGANKYLSDLIYSYDPNMKLSQIRSEDSDGNTTTIKNVCTDEYCLSSNVDLIDSDCIGKSCEGRNDIGNIITNNDEGKTVNIENKFGVFGERFTVKTVEYTDDDVKIETKYKYDILGNLTVVERGGINKVYEYDLSKSGKSKLLKGRVEPESGKHTYNYYENGLLKNEFHNDSQISLLSYDKLGRLVSADYQDEMTKDLTFVYDTKDLLDYSLAGDIKVDYDYYANKKLKGHTLIKDSHSFKLGFEYDLNANLEKIIYPTGREIELSPDSLGRPTKVGNYISDIDYYGDSHAVSFMAYANGISHTMTLNEKYQPEIYNYSIAGVNLFNETYGYYPDEVIKSITDSVNGVNNLSLEYDRYNRMTAATGRWGRWDYGYDTLDNITSITKSNVQNDYSYNTNNLLTSAMGKSFTYDARGNATSNGANTFTYNLANQLIAVPSQGVVYEYDANGNRSRIGPTLGTDSKFELHDNSGSLFYEFDNTNGKSIDYIYAGKTLVAKVESGTQDTDGDGIVDYIEEKYGLDKNYNDAAEDLDGDGISNVDEINQGLLPNNEDSDGDLIPDGYETLHGLNPLYDDSSADKDTDGLSNYQEYLAKTDPANPDSDNDGILDGLDSSPLVNFAVLTIITNSLLLN